MEQLKQQLAIHTTDRQNWKRCRQQWHFSSNLRMNLEPAKVTMDDARMFGTGIHHALANYYEPSTPRDGGAAIDSWLEFCDNFRHEYERDNNELWNEELEVFEATRDLGVNMLRHYCFEFAPTVDKFNVLWVEREYKIPIGVTQYGAELVYSLRVDGLVEDFAGRLWILEHKTAKKISENRRWLQMDEQCGSYAWGIQQAEGVVIEGVFYNSILKRAMEPLKILKNGKFSVDKRQVITYKAAFEQIHEAHEPDEARQLYGEFLEYLRVREETDGNPFFKRELIRRNKNELVRLGEMIKEEAHEMTGDPLIYRNPGPFTCSYCAFYDPCIALYEGSDYQALLDTLYKPRTGYERPDF